MGGDTQPFHQPTEDLEHPPEYFGRYYASAPPSAAHATRAARKEVANEHVARRPQTTGAVDVRPQAPALQWDVGPLTETWHRPVRKIKPLIWSTGVLDPCRIRPIVSSLKEYSYSRAYGCNLLAQHVYKAITCVFMYSYCRSTLSNSTDGTDGTQGPVENGSS